MLCAICYADISLLSATTVNLSTVDILQVADLLKSEKFERTTYIHFPKLTFLILYN